MGFAGVLIVVLTIAASVLGMGLGLVDSLNQDFTVSASDVNIQTERTGDPANNTVNNTIIYGDAGGDAPTLQPDEFNKIIAICSDGTRTTISAGNETIEAGDVLVADASTLGCPTGDTVSVSVVTPNGDEETIGQVKLPADNDATLGTGQGGATADGSESGSGDGTVGFIIETLTIEWDHIWNWIASVSPSQR